MVGWAGISRILAVPVEVERRVSRSLVVRLRQNQWLKYRKYCHQPYPGVVPRLAEALFPECQVLIKRAPAENTAGMLVPFTTKLDVVELEMVPLLLIRLLM